MKKLCILIAVLVMLCNLSAQTFGEIGSGTASSNLPCYALWGYAWSSCIYPAAGFGGARTITQLAFNEINAATPL